MVKVIIIYKVYLSIGALEFALTSNYTKKVNFAPLGVILVVVGCKTLSCI